MLDSPGGPGEDVATRQGHQAFESRPAVLATPRAVSVPGPYRGSVTRRCPCPFSASAPSMPSDYHLARESIHFGPNAR